MDRSRPEDPPLAPVLLSCAPLIAGCHESHLGWPSVSRPDRLAPVRIRLRLLWSGHLSGLPESGALIAAKVDHFFPVGQAVVPGFDRDATVDHHLALPAGGHHAQKPMVCVLAFVFPTMITLVIGHSHGFPLLY